MELAAGTKGTIDKRTFLAALACPSMAWYDHRSGGAEMTPALEWLFFGGNQVGEAARAQLAVPGAQLQFEKTFHSGALVARADAIRRAGEEWELIEVKSAKDPKDGKEVDDKYIDDLAYTAMVAHAAGLQVGRCILMLLSRTYRLGEPGALMVEVDVSVQVRARAAEFAVMAGELSAAILAANVAVPELKVACRKCAYFASDCLGKGIATSIFVLPGLSDKKLKQMRPIVDLHQLPATVDLTDNQRRVFDVMRSGQPLVMDGLDRLRNVEWPAYYLDFETVTPVLPWFSGDGASDQHTFQYSIHVRDSLSAVPIHHEYLAPTSGDWRRDMTEQMLGTLGEHGSVVVFTNFEKDRLEELAALFPDLAGRITGVINRLWDLNDVIKRGYVHPGFKGSTSIKKVLPVMVPDLESGYLDMRIGEGQSASGVFGLMRVGKYEAPTFDSWRHDLLEYCKLDTMAMVRVHEALALVPR